MEDSPLLIRLATIDDLANVQSCARAAYSKYIDRMNRTPAPMIADFAAQIEHAQVYVAHRNSKFNGYVVFYPQEDHVHLENIAVMPACAGQGVGRRLMELVEQTARDAGAKAVELYTNEVMTENIFMYIKLGYIEIERKQHSGFNRVFFRKLI